MNQEIPFEVIHEGIIESTIPFSNKMIDDGKQDNFLMNCDEQTHGRGSGNRKWASQKGNALTTLNIKENYMPKDTIKLTPYLIAISVCEHLNKIARDKFVIKWPNDILCNEQYKVCGILVDKYKDFYQLSFGINLSQCPDSSEIRKGGRIACKLGNHSDNIPNPLEFSKLLCKDICFKLKTYNCQKIIEEWKKNAIFDIKITKRNDESGKLYKPLDIDIDGKLKAVDDDGKEEIIDPQFAFVEKINECKKLNDWSAEEFLTGEFTNNLGSHCKLVAKDGKITGEYFTKPARGNLIKPGFPVNGIYTPVKDGALLTMIVTYILEDKKKNDLENISQCTWNGKVYSNKEDFKMNWLLNCNESEKDEWCATNIGQDHFTKKTK